MTAIEKVKKVNSLIAECRCQILEITHFEVTLMSDFIKWQLVKDLVVETTGVPWDLIISAERTIEITNARFLFIYFAREYARTSTTETGRIINRDHSSITRAMVVIRGRIFSKDPVFYAPYLIIKKAFADEDIH